MTLTVQSEEAVEEKEDCAIAVSPEMQMKQEEVEQLKDCEAMNADWTVIQSRRQQREERQQKDGGEASGQQGNQCIKLSSEPGTDEVTSSTPLQTLPNYIDSRRMG